MPQKNEINKVSRKERIEKKTTQLLKDGICDSVRAAHEWLADNHYDCSYSTIYRAVRPQNFRQTTLELFPTNQLKLF